MSAFCNPFTCLVTDNIPISTSSPTAHDYHMVIMAHVSTYAPLRAPLINEGAFVPVLCCSKMHMVT